MKQANPFDKAVHSHCVQAGTVSITLILRLLNQTTGGAHVRCLWPLDFVFEVLFSCFYRNNSISNEAEHYPRV
jgi:hypothetical protein